jgi:hypothetical protein
VPAAAAGTSAVATVLLPLLLQQYPYLSLLLLAQLELLQ